MKLAARNNRRASPSWVGNRLTQLRTQAGLSKAEVARLMRVDDEVPRRLELGAHHQRLDLLARYCTAVGADLEAVFSADIVDAA